MYVKTTKRRGQHGQSYAYHELVENAVDGYARRRYLKHSAVPAARRRVEQYRQRQGAEQRIRQALRQLAKRSPGRPRYFPPAVAELLSSAGFSIYGSRIALRRDAHRDPEAMAIHFALLSPEVRAALRTPANLAKAIDQAWRRLREQQRRRIPGCCFEEAFQAAVVELQQNGAAPESEDGDDG